MKQSNLSFLLKYLKKYRILLIFSLVLSLVSSLLTLLIPYLVGLVIDLLIGFNLVDMNQVINYCLIILLISVVISISQYLAGIINNKICFLMTKDLRNDLNSKIHR